LSKSVDYQDPQFRFKQFSAFGFISAAMVLMCMNQMENIKLKQCANWPTAAGIITKVDFSPGKSNGGYYDLLYKFDVGSFSFTSNKITGRSTSQRVESPSEVPKVNDKITVHYNPTDPHDALLKTIPVESSGWYVFALFTFFTAISSFLNIIPGRKAGANLKKRTFPPLRRIWEFSSPLPNEEIIKRLEAGFRPVSYESMTVMGRKTSEALFYVTVFCDQAFDMAIGGRDGCSVLRGKVFPGKNHGSRIQAYFDSNCIPSIYFWWMWGLFLFTMGLVTAVEYNPDKVSQIVTSALCGFPLFAIFLMLPFFPYFFDGASQRRMRTALENVCQAEISAVQK